VDESSIPHYLRFPVESPADWAEMKQRFAWDEPTRALDEAELARARAAAPTQMVTIFFVGFYGQLRNWLGMENLSYAFYEQPAMVHDMVEHWAELCARQLERLPLDIPIDHVSWWEDMASKNGPLCSPTTFREFLQPGYRRVMSVARARGCDLAIVDCDGNPGALVANWLEEGVNIMFPLEVAAGVDAYAWRREYGLELRLRGGVGKVPLVQGGAAIDRELDRLRPLFEQGRCIPHLDHLVPPDIPYAHYCQYLEKKRRLIGKA
jgi:uroporphyrinogen decarboxylase